MRSVDVLGVRVDDVTYAEALHVLLAALVARVPHVVTTPNPEIVLLARADASFRAVLNRAALNAESATGGHRWFLLGGYGDTAATAAAALQRMYPGLIVVGAAPGSPDPADDATTRALIRSAAPIDVLLVAYGAPKQERWLDRNLAALEIPVGIGVGGVFNYLSGATPRAPRWVRRLHFEWLHRLLTQPRRWRRQLALPRFALLAVAVAIRRRIGAR